VCDRVLRKIFVLKRDDVTGGWRKLHNEELHSLLKCFNNHNVNANSLQQMWERGLMKHEWLKWRPTKPRCVLKRDVVRVEIATISFAFSLLAFGLFASVSILIVERLYHDRYFQLVTLIHLEKCYTSESLVTKE
jgi:hypothetical protein